MYTVQRKQHRLQGWLLCMCFYSEGPRHASLSALAGNSRGLLSLGQAARERDAHRCVRVCVRAGDT